MLCSSFRLTCNERRVHRCVGGVDRGQVGVNADVRDDHVHVRRFHDTADNGLNLCDVVITHFEAGAAGHPYIDDELARVSAREVGPAKEWEEHKHCQCDAAKNCCRSEAWTPHRALCKTFVPIEHALEFLVEDALEASEESRLIVLPV